MNRDDLESLIHRRLAQLPPPRAPGTLVPRVMAQVRRRRPSPWYGRPWVAWPRVWQVVSLVLFVGLSVVAWFGIEGAGGGPMTNVARSVETSIQAVTGTAEALAGSLRVLRRVILERIAGYLGYLMVVTGIVCTASALVCAALARLLGNLVWKGSVGR